MEPRLAVLIGLACLLLAPASSTAQPKPIVIGQTYVASGSVASLSSEPLLGIRALLKATNESGGIKGRTVDLRQLDDANDSAKAASNVRQLADEGAVAILMPIGTNSAVGALRAGNDLKIPVIAPYSGAGPVAQFSPYGFPLRISFDQEYGRIVDHLLTLGVTRIAFAHNDNPGARSALDATRNLIERRGHRLDGSVSIANDGSDAEEKAQLLAKSSPTAVILSVSTPVGARFIKAYRATGAETRFYSFSFLNGPSLHKAIGPDSVGVVISQVVPYPWTASVPLVIEYQAAMRKSGVTDFSYASLEGYISAKMLVDALRRAGPVLSGEAIKKALESFTAHDLGGLVVRYSPTDHKGLGFSELSMVRNNGGYIR